MINHLRTLLLNLPGTVREPPAFPGEEYVPPEYSQLEWPRTFRVVRNTLFGLNPDRAMLNYRLRELLSLVHTTELVDYATQLDPRITYWPSKKLDLYRQAFNVRAQQIAGTAKAFYPIGALYADDGAGRIYHRWRVTVLDGDTVAVSRLYPPLIEGEQLYSTSDNLSSIVSLPGSTQQFRFEVGTGSSWYVTAVARPRRNLSDVLAALDDVVTEIDEIAIFSTDPVEPYLTFRNLWRNHTQLPYRLCGLVLALGYRLDGLHRERGGR